MTAKAFCVAPKDYARPLSVVGEYITVLASGSTTGSYEVFLQSGPEGSGPQPHAHPWDETFFVTDGEVDFSIEGQEVVVAKAGTLVHLPSGTNHWFRWREGGGAMISITSRLGASRFFSEIDSAVIPDKPDGAKLRDIAMRHGLTVPSP